METLIFDIETGPLPAEQLEALLPAFNPAEVKLGNTKDPAKIAEKIEEARAGHRRDFFDRAALDALTGRVLAIGVRCGERTELLGDGLDEQELIAAFWARCRGQMGRVHRLVGFNIAAFDLPFLFRRSWALRVAVPFGLRRGRYWSDQVVDLREIWQLGDRQARGNLDAVARHLGLGAKNGSGKEFATLWQTDRAKALDYLRNDLEMTARVAAALGVMPDEDARMLHGRVRHFPPASLTRLLTHNLQVDKWNNFQLADLAGEPVVLPAAEEGPEFQREFLKKNLLTPASLVLKRGARVMFTINRTERGQRQPLFVNGQTGVVERVEVRGQKSEVRVERDGDGARLDVEPFTWRFSKDPGAATFTQFPLRLAYAMTIHKSQGLTLREALVDICAALEPGQAYVAVSRVRSTNGLHLRGWFKGVCFSPRAVEFYRGIKG